MTGGKAPLDLRTLWRYKHFQYLLTYLLTYFSTHARTHIVTPRDTPRDRDEMTSSHRRRQSYGIMSFAMPRQPADHVSVATPCRTNTPNDTCRNCRCGITPPCRSSTSSAAVRAERGGALRHPYRSILAGISRSAPRHTIAEKTIHDKMAWRGKRLSAEGRFSNAFG